MTQAEFEAELTKRQAKFWARLLLEMYPELGLKTSDPQPAPELEMENQAG